MNLFTSLMSISLGAILVNNFILAQFLGICPFMGVSQKTGTAMGMGLAVTFVMGIASAVTWAVNTYILVPLDLQYMQTVAFILVIAALVLPLITTNCAVLGVALLNIQKSYNFIESVVYGITGGIGFLVAIVLFASIREHTEDADCPKSFRGFPIALISAGLLALAFMGFSGMKIFG